MELCALQGCLYNFSRLFLRGRSVVSPHTTSKARLKEYQTDMFLYVLPFQNKTGKLRIPRGGEPSMFQKCYYSGCGCGGLKTHMKCHQSEGSAPIQSTPDSKIGQSPFKEISTLKGYVRTYRESPLCRSNEDSG